MRAVVVAVGACCVGVASTAAVVTALVDDRSTAVVFIVILLAGPAWALCSAAVSSDEEYVEGARPRSWWLRVLPWTFVLAPLVLPNLILLTGFLRDSRADGGRSVLSWDRMRPGEGGSEHHWPD